MLKYRRLIKNLINRPREPAITDISSTPYPPPLLQAQLLSPPLVELIDAVVLEAGWGRWRNQQPLAPWFDVTDALKCAWPGAYQGISVAVPPWLCFGHLTPDPWDSRFPPPPFFHPFFFQSSVLLASISLVLWRAAGRRIYVQKSGTCHGTLTRMS